MKNRKIIKKSFCSVHGKKATELSISDLFAMVIWVLVVLIFVIIFMISFKGCGKSNPVENKIVSGQSYNVEANLLLINYLRAPISGGVISNTDLVLAWHNADPNSKDVWKTRIIDNAKIVFERKYGRKCYFLFISSNANAVPDTNVPNSIALGQKPGPMMPGFPDLPSEIVTESKIMIPALDGTNILVYLDIKNYARHKNNKVTDENLRRFCEIP